MMHIDNETYCVKEVNHYKTQIAKLQIIIGTSLRKDHNHIVRLQHKELGKTKKWNTFTVSRDGTIYQHYDSVYHSDFIGIKEVDKKSISIVLENMGCLFQTPDDENINWLHEVCDKNNVIEKEWLGYKYWENFSNEQLNSTVELCKMLCEEYNIPRMVMGFHHYHKDTIKFRGIVFRSNYIEGSSDINPIFSIENFNHMLHNE
jgi:N-acetyl-anhydromuramyl-L-alanine amidase AmpD